MNPAYGPPLTKIQLAALKQAGYIAFRSPHDSNDCEIDCISEKPPTERNPFLSGKQEFLATTNLARKQKHLKGYVLFDRLESGDYPTLKSIIMHVLRVGDQLRITFNENVSNQFVRDAGHLITESVFLKIHRPRKRGKPIFMQFCVYKLTVSPEACCRVVRT